MIAGHYKQRRDAGVEVAALKLRLICPLTKRRIVVPARSVNCTHVQCFDMASYLRMQITAEHPIWTCPICKVPAAIGRLKIDEFTSKVLASEQTQNAEDVTLHQDGTFEPVVPFQPSGVVTQEDLEFVADENPLNVEDIKPVLDRGCSASNDSSAELQGSDRPEYVADEPSAPAKRARLDTALATMERQAAQPDGRVDPPEAFQASPDDIQARTTSDAPGQRDQADAVIDIRPHITLNCVKQFTSKKSFEEHRSKHHLTNVTPGPCTQCSSRYKKRTVYHCEGHHLLRPFSCANCTRSFRTRQMLNRHGRDHASPHPTRCRSCGGVFRDVQAFVDHFKGAHGEKVYYCPLCQDAFTVDQEAHVSSAYHQETLTMRTNCSKLKISCAKCSKRMPGAEFLLHAFQEDIRQWSLSKHCGDCRRNLRKDGKTSRG
ncbi:zinc finger MIZ domain-containing protein 1-like [Aphelenchoides avenae]|nr:zinc finger MIZ domain-containing protein 1-like [Aphelenchus avenae]